MRLGWFGKLLVLDYAVKAFSKMIDGGGSGTQGEASSDFSQVEMRALMMAAERRDGAEFRRIYLERYPREPEDRIVEHYGWFVDRASNGWM